MTIGWGFTHLDGELQRRDNVVLAGPSCCRRAQWPGYSPALSGLSTPTVNKSSHDSRKFRNAQKPLVFKAFWLPTWRGFGVDIARAPKKSSKFFLRDWPCDCAVRSKSRRYRRTGAAFARRGRSSPSPRPLIWSFGQASIDDHGTPQHGGGRFIESLGGALRGRSGIPVKFSRPYL